MTRRTLAVAMFAVASLLLVCAVVVPLAWGAGASALANPVVGPGAFGFMFSLMGLLLTTRRPENRIGWAFTVTGLLFEVQAATIAYADAGLRAHAPHLAGAAYAGNLTQWIFAPAVLTGYTLPFLWFPDGRLPSRRWRWVAATAVVSTVVMCAVNIGAPGPLNNYRHVQNPLSFDLGPFGPLAGFGFVTYVGALFGSVVAVVIRYRRSRGIERLQMRWFMVGVAGTVASFGLQLVLLVLTGDVGAGVLLMSILPVCAAVAILRYRLFDIDRVISRTVTYTAVTGLLVVPYVVLTVVAGRLAQGSSLTVAALTLVTLALLRPLRRRVQTRVDRRFNRESYDAARTVEAFALRLRDEVDPQVVRTDLLTVTALAMQPSRLSLWSAP